MAIPNIVSKDYSALDPTEFLRGNIFRDWTGSRSTYGDFFEATCWGLNLNFPCKFVKINSDTGYAVFPFLNTSIDDDNVYNVCFSFTGTNLMDAAIPDTTYNVMPPYDSQNSGKVGVIKGTSVHTLTSSQIQVVAVNQSKSTSVKNAVSGKRFFATSVNSNNHGDWYKFGFWHTADWIAEYLLSGAFVTTATNVITGKKWNCVLVPVYAMDGETAPNVQIYEKWEAILVKGDQVVRKSFYQLTKNTDEAYVEMREFIVDDFIIDKVYHVENPFTSTILGYTDGDQYQSFGITNGFRTGVNFGDKVYDIQYSSGYDTNRSHIILVEHKPLS